MQSLAARIKQHAKLKGQFTLRSGRVSDTYFDKYQFEAEPELLLAAAKEMAELVPSGTEVLAGLEMGGIPVVTMLSQVTGLPAAFIRKLPKGYGTRRKALFTFSAFEPGDEQECGFDGGTFTCRPKL